MVLGAFLDFVGRTFSECRCRPESKVDPIEFNPGAAINVGYHWLSFFKRLTVPPYAAVPTPPCKPPCRKKCCKVKRNAKPCNVICQRKRKGQQNKKCMGPCCQPWQAPPAPQVAEPPQRKPPPVVRRRRTKCKNPCPPEPCEPTEPTSEEKSSNIT